MILPNDRNVHMAAEHAAENASKPVRIVPTVSLQAGLAAMVAFDPAAPAEDNADAMTTAADEVATGAVTLASRDVETNGVAVSKGAWLGLADGVPVAGGASFEEVTRAVLERLLAEPRSVLTMLTGRGAAGARRRARGARARIPRPRARGARGRPAALRAC